MPICAQVFTWLTALGVLVPSVSVAQDRTERELLELIVRDGPQARAIRAEVEVTRREQLARLAYPNPGLMYSREGAGFTEFLQLEQSLPVFGTRAALSRAGLAATAAAEADQDARLWIVRSDALLSLTRLHAEHGRLEAARAHTGDVERLIEILRTREREGEGSRFDRLRAEQELRDARQLVTSASVALADANAALRAMLPRDTSAGRIAPPDRPYGAAPALDALLTRAASARVELRALSRLADRAAREAEASRRARLPAPTIFAGVKRADGAARREHGGLFGLTVSVPLFDTGDREAARWVAERARVETEREFIDHQIRSEVVRASEAFAVRQSAAAEDAENAGTELARIAEVAYREGEVGILELLDALRTASRARTRTIDLRLDARLAAIALERAVGDVLWP